MKNKDRYFIGICAGMPFGLVGVCIGTLLTWVLIKFIGNQDS
jgi:hypothetical protein